jgi:SAM-dependent methyltransferase
VTGSTLHDRYRASYDKLAAAYMAHWRETGSNPFIPDDEAQEQDKRTAELIRQFVPAGSRILDVGCAVGNVLGMLPEYDRHGIDIAEAYLEVARQRGLNATVGEAEHLPYPDDSFDAALAADIFEHVIDPNLVAAEMLRVVRPGGLLFIRSPDSEDMTGWVDYTVYEYTHLRRWDGPTWYLFWRRIFGADIVTTVGSRQELNVVVRVP